MTSSISVSTTPGFRQAELEAFELLCTPDFFRDIAQIAETKTATWPGGILIASLIEHISHHSPEFAMLGPGDDEAEHQLLVDVVGRTAGTEIVRGFTGSNSMLRRGGRNGILMQRPVREVVMLDLVDGVTVVTTVVKSAVKDEPLFHLEGSVFIDQIWVIFNRPIAQEEGRTNFSIILETADHMVAEGQQILKNRIRLEYDATTDSVTFNGDFDPRFFTLLAAELTQMHSEQSHASVTVPSQVREFVRHSVSQRFV